MGRYDGMTADERRLEQFADALEPVAEILADKEISEAAKNGEPHIKIIKKAIKGHRKSVIELLSIAEGLTVAEYRVPPAPALAMKLVAALNDQDIKELFFSQIRGDAGASGASIADTEGGGS